jgi:hypothetical protein
MSPEQQQATVDEIAASLGISGQTPGTANPSPAFNDALSAASQASQFASGPIAPRSEPRAAPTNLEGSIATTLAGINTVPVVGPLLQNTSDAILGAGSVLTGGDYGQTVEGLRRRREELAKGNPIANLAGSAAANLAAFGVAGAPRAVAQGLSPAALTLAGGETIGSTALGVTGSTGARIASGLGSTLGLTAADNMVRGQAPLEATQNAVLPALVGGAIPAVGAGVRKTAEGVADAATRAVQSRMTSNALQGAPNAASLRSAASSMFDAATGGTPLAISDNAYFRFLGDVQQFANKLRINADNDPQATGLLSTLMRIADETSQGVAIDMKDLHLIRQLAGKVAGSAQGRDAALGSKVVSELDNFIQSLKPADILGGADPTQAANSLMRGISTWSRASKVGLIEEAIQKAETYKSGMENGLRLQFQALLRNPSTRKLFNAAERTELEKVANGTAGSNLVTLLGKFGFSNSGAPNWMGGVAGVTAGSMTPLGPIGGLLAAGVGAGARKASETMGVNAANRAAQAVATPNLPIAAPIPVPQSLLSGITAAELAARGALLGGS